MASSPTLTQTPVSAFVYLSPAVAMEEIEIEPKKQSSVAPSEAKTLIVDAPAPTKTNGFKLPEEEDTANDDDLTPPPENMSPVSSGNERALEDEIVVGSNRNGIIEKSSPLRVVSDQEDETMPDVDDDRPIVASASHYPKRKRASVFHDLSEDKMESSLVDEKESTPRTAKPPRRHGLGGVKGVTLGYWRDSPVPNEEGKHAVIGFIDVRDRLRTRVQPNTRSGEPVSNIDYPLPPGPGGSWVTFERVVFAKHLVGLDHFHIKEYVKIRADAHEDSDEARLAAEKAAAKEAVRRVQANPPPEPAVQPAVAYGVEIPEGVAHTPRPDAKRRRTGSGIGTISAGGPITQEPQAHHLDPLPGTRPTRIVLGYWKGSSEPNPDDRHAVYGILGQNDMFRVKVVRETRDGRFVDGNFPSGAGALWIHYEEVEFEPHLKELNRAEVKEYCRVRQRQLDDKEMPEDRVANETHAVFEAQARVAQGYKSTNHHLSSAFQPPQAEDEGAFPDVAETKTESGGHELRQTRRAESRAPRHSLPDVEIRQSSRTPTLNDRAKAETIARREIARVEAAQLRAERHAEQRAAAVSAATAAAADLPPVAPALAPTPKLASNGTRMSSLFHERDEMQRLNKVWASQEEHRSKAGVEDTKFYSGIKYERKTNGPFVGKLVSQGTIISIDGEDYVEYRVLTKPSFF